MRREPPGKGDGSDVESVASALRDVVLRTVPGVEETLLWGSRSYHRPAVGGRVKGSVCLVTVKRGHVRLEFIHGIRLRDPKRLLRGEGVSKRHVPIATAEDARRPEIAALIAEAAAVRF